MSETIIALIVTSIISVISLIISFIISLKALIISKPKLAISISDKSCDVYYGNVAAKDDKAIATKIGAVAINIINNSPVDIAIVDIKLQIGKDKHRLVTTENPFWEECYFYYINEENERDWDGAGINYKESGFDLPMKVASYSIESGICLFHDFPNITAKKVTGTLLITSAVGKIKKKVKFIEYNKDYISSELKDVMLYNKNCREDRS